MSLRAACGVQGRVLYSEINGVRIAYTRTGQGRPLVCLHAIGHGGRDYEAFTQQIGADYEVIVVDWPNHGGSGDDVQPTSAARYAQVLVGLLDQLGIQRPIIVGNSIGGAAAILAAEQREVAALVLCDSGGLVAVNGFVRATTRLFAAFFNAGAHGARWFGWAYRQYYRWMILPSSAAAAQRERIIGAGYESAATLRDAWQSFGRPDADLRQAAAGLQVPILVAWAARDQVIPLWMCRPAIRKLQRAELVTFSAGHAVFLERPEAFAAAFRGWVAHVDFGVHLAAEAVVA